ncbi:MULTISPECIES: 2-amino-3,7-dideoxy-D-threo-hept-6-ulosonate synthase [Dactylosporangium]|uniref:2-amino-3,7-dideoxy-D-threo-hept-6-ulosonate synthase n=1 Tax=Dactylosporangium vinaceum TaxID=53362 RepID=A0ABV5LZX4_9ACTN|nr:MULTISPECIES: 2-amino-3,7-dideoxy-D-threo-hept-6-ulosonate synthase [Dactylosporangium]UAB94346.1 2-amino-4,5-dihydroxy-6-one-heptanoic acid-7-phosphate synthase [Dactylosporangium vinaceum]UWZ42745.1 2-amino-4,5-dihydroxy-6-one-heptanoic acid-7-phosphate synthase [Dactylosporangium matsuzakiense]
MVLNDSFARRVRLERLHRNGSGGLLVVPLDHPISGDPILHSGARGGLDRLVGALAANGADAVVLHKGAVRQLDPQRLRDMCLIVHLSAGTGLSGDPDAKVLVCSVEEALRTGADGVSVHVNAGSRTESRQLADLAAVAGSCARWGVPLLAMVYARGPDIADGRAPHLVAQAAAIAAELGADIVKTAMPRALADLAELTAASPIPVLAAGGDARDPTAALAHLADAMRAGAGGVAAGRLVFNAADPGAMVRRLAALVHDRIPAHSR